MKRLKNMSQAELAAYIQDALQVTESMLFFQAAARFPFTAATNTSQKIWI
ncbi:MAG: hypothetical protein ACOYYF_05990 [Chloroflexota bacterium]